MRRAFFAERGMLAIRAAALSIEFACLDSNAKPFECIDGVAIVKIEGPLTQRPTFIWDNYESIRARVAAAFADTSSRAVMLEINSPGGVVDGVFEPRRGFARDGVGESDEAIRRVYGFDGGERGLRDRVVGTGDFRFIDGPSRIDRRDQRARRYDRAR